MGKKVFDLFDISYLEEEKINVKDLMFFINTNCNLSCKHCYVGQDKKRNVKFEKDEARNILRFFGEKGLERLTFLGGEPSIHPNIVELIKVSSEYSIDERRITTNGINIDFINNIDPKDLSHISFSLDGHNSMLHEFLRGKGTFQKTLNNIKKAQDKGFITNITYSVNGLNKNYVIEGLDFFHNLGINEINFHLTSMIGDAKGNDLLYVEPKEWIELRKKIISSSNLSGLKLRIPLMFVDKSEYKQELAEGYSCLIDGSYHSKEKGNRILLYPTGKVYTCCKLSSSGFNFGFFRNGIFLPNPSNNELCEFRKNPKHPCIASKLLEEKTDGYIPLCISYKKKVIL